MASKGFVEYKKRVAAGITAVDNEICKGVSMSDVEWFDFNTKSALLGYKSRGTRLYNLLNHKLVKLAEIYAEALTFMADIDSSGFTMNDYEAMLRYLAKKLHSIERDTVKAKVKAYDKNGVFYVFMGFDQGYSIEVSVSSKADALKWLIYFVRCCTDIVDSFVVSKDLRKYLDGYLAGEMRKIVTRIFPTPYKEYNASVSESKGIYAAGGIV